MHLPCPCLLLQAGGRSVHRLLLPNCRFLGLLAERGAAPALARGERDRLTARRRLQNCLDHPHVRDSLLRVGLGRVVLEDAARKVLELRGKLVALAERLRLRMTIHGEVMLELIHVFESWFDAQVPFRASYAIARGTRYAVAD